MRGAILVIVMPACSFVFTAGPGTLPHGELPTCSTSRAPIVADALSAIPALTVGALNTNMLALGIPALAIGALYVASTFYGWSQTSACRDAFDDALLAMARDAAAGNCAPVITFAKRLLTDDPATLRLVLANPSFERCFTPASD